LPALHLLQLQLKLDAFSLEVVLPSPKPLCLFSKVDGLTCQSQVRWRVSGLIGGWRLYVDAVALSSWVETSYLIEVVLRVSPQEYLEEGMQRGGVGSGGAQEENTTRHLPTGELLQFELEHGHYILDPVCEIRKGAQETWGWRQPLSSDDLVVDIGQCVEHPVALLHGGFKPRPRRIY
jgi:hypothetical protein